MRRHNASKVQSGAGESVALSSSMDERKGTERNLSDEHLKLAPYDKEGMLGCGSFVRGRKRKKGDSIPFILSRGDYMSRLHDECP